jgi:hypothetical protein
VSDYYLALFRNRHCDPETDEALMIQHVDVRRDDAEAILTVRLRLAADAIAAWLAQHQEVML